MPPKRSDTVEALLAGAEQAFCERGFHGASIGYICQCAGRTTGAFYSNYDSKLKLFLDVYRRHIDRTTARVEERLAEVESARDPAPQLARTIADIMNKGFDERWLFLTIEFRLMALRDKVAATALIEHEERFRRELGDLLEALFTRTGQRPTLNGYELAVLLGAMTRGFSLDRGIRTAVGGGEPVQRDTVVRALEGLLAGPGGHPAGG